MARDQPQIVIRVSPDLKTAIHAAAAANKRSVNSELLFMLERAYLEAPEANPAAILRPRKAPHGAGLWF